MARDEREFPMEDAERERRHGVNSGVTVVKHATSFMLCLATLNERQYTRTNLWCNELADVWRKEVCLRELFSELISD